MGGARKHIKVVGAVIVDEGKVLCAQRGAGALAGMWEFPGGKIESGETAEEALAREIHEELGCEIRVGGLVGTTCHDYDFGMVELTTYYCALTSGIPRSLEHTELVWLTPAELHTLEWAPADVPAMMSIVARG